jgi:hypothetical protein
MKNYVVAAALVGLFSVTPALAEDMKCDDASMANVQKMIDGATDPAMKAKVDAAKADLLAAQDAMKAQKADECAAALTKAAAGLTAQ